MDHALISGMAWTAAGKWTTQALTWVSTLIVARLLSPEDFGILGMALVILGLVQLVNEFGLGAAVIHNHELTAEKTARLAGLSLGLGFLFAAVSLALSWPVAGFFGEPRVQPVMALMSVALIASGLQIVPRATLTRDLRFKALAIVDGTQALVAAAVTLVLAILGTGYWALVLGNLVAKGFATVLVLVLAFRPLKWPGRLQELIQELMFGGHMTLANVGWFVFGQSDSIIVGRLLGTGPLGAYSIAANLASAPINQLTSLLVRVTSGVFSAIKEDRRALHRYIRVTSEAQSLLIFPAAIGLAVVAEDFVHVVLGAHWSGTVAPLQFLAVTAAFRCLGPVLMQALIYSGHPEQNSKITLLGALVLPPLFLLGSHWGIKGVAFGWLIGYAGLLLPLILHACGKHLGLPISAFLKSLLPATVSTLVMSAVVLFVGAATVELQGTALRLVGMVLVGAVVYTVTLRGFYWDRILSIYHMVQLSKRAGDVSAASSDGTRTG